LKNFKTISRLNFNSLYAFPELKIECYVATNTIISIMTVICTHGTFEPHCLWDLCTKDMKLRYNSEVYVASLSVHLCFISWITKRISIKFGMCTSRDSAIGIATGYGLDGRGVGVRVPVGWRIFFSPRRHDRFWGPTSLLSSGYPGIYPRSKGAGVWCCPLTFN
jgi:hypothetical protein